MKPPRRFLPLVRASLLKMPGADSEKKPLHLEWWGTGHRCIGAVTEDGLPLHNFLLQMELL